MDRFHISTRAYQLKTCGRDYDFGWLEERLDALGFHLVFLSRAPDSFAAARAGRLKVSGNRALYDNLQILIEAQELMRRLVGKTHLPTPEMDISDSDVAHACDRIADWMESTGGLWIKG